MNGPNADLKRLLDCCGIVSEYRDARQVLKHASVDSLLAVLNCLGVEISRPDDARHVLPRWQCGRLSRGIEPVLVAWDGRLADFNVHLPQQFTRSAVKCQVRLPHDDKIGKYGIKFRELPVRQAKDATALGFATRKFRIVGNLPAGYHRLTVQTPTGTLESLIVSAPMRAFSEAAPRQSREWGCFLPLYALRSERNWGAGDLTDLSKLIHWTSELGGTTVGTLPLVSAFLDEPCDPSPYSPVSRLFWNEFYIDVEATPELKYCRKAQQLVNSNKFAREVAACRQADAVPYKSLMRLKRQVLSLLAEQFFETKPSRFAAFQRFVRGNRLVEDYAQFRAVCEKRRKPWMEWPARLRNGELKPDDFSPQAMRYHLYAQWIVDEQMRSLERASTAAGCGFYLDLPLGVRLDGYDVWRHRSDYASSASAGAPPDPVFTKGQNWAFPPLHPQKIREHGYRHLRDVLAHQFQFARRLRIDHVMGLHRLYWIPGGLPASQGVYVRYPANELYAILSLESHRNRCTIIGEDLGTVPDEVKREMKQHHLRRMYVVQYELDGTEDGRLAPPARQSVASFNTHDMPTFASWCTQADLADRRDLGLLDDRGQKLESRRRTRILRALANWFATNGHLIEADKEPSAPRKSHRKRSDKQPAQLFPPLVEFLAASPAELVLINLEDLWQEMLPQNTPGTFEERVNWRRKARLSFEDFSADPRVIPLLKAVDAARRRRKPAARSVK